MLKTEEVPVGTVVTRVAILKEEDGFRANILIGDKHCDLMFDTYEELVDAISSNLKSEKRPPLNGSTTSEELAKRVLEQACH